MAEGQGPGPGVERPSDFGSSVARWDAELRTAEDATKTWRADAKRIAQRYALEGGGGERGSDRSEVLPTTAAAFNILHSNIQTLLPAVFGQEPMPVVMRRHRDPDPIGRAAAMICERAVKTELETDGFYDVMRRVTQDLLITGRGVPWVRFAPTIVAEPDGMGGQVERVVSARTPLDYVLWDNFLHAPKTTWAEVREGGWVARRVSMTRDQGVRRFGAIFHQVPLGIGETSEGDLTDDTAHEAIGQASVWEIWDVMSRKAIWLCRDYQDSVLDERDDPLGLDQFFPCPKPAFGTLANEKLVPTPDYLQYERLAKELDDQTSRISTLVKAVRATGIFDSTVEGIGRMLEDEGIDQNELIPVKNFDAIQGRGMEDIVKFLPLGDIVSAIVALYDARDRTKQVLYEVSGLSDIMRGSLDNKYEKLGQSRIKGQFASQRIQQKIRVIEECARDVIRIKAEIMVEHYDPVFLRELSGYDFIPEIAALRNQGEEGSEGRIQGQQQIEMLFHQAITLLKNDKMRGFRIDVETNSTVMANDDAEKEGRVEFLRSAGEFLERALPVALQVPQFASLMGDMMLFAVRGFRAGRQLESAFEEAVERIKGQAAQAEGGEQRDPAAEAEAQKAQAEAQKVQLDAEAHAQKTKMDAAVAQMKAQSDIAVQRAQVEAEQMKVAAAVQQTQAELAARMAEIEAEMERLKLETEAKRQAALADIATAKAKAKEGGE